MNLCYIYFNFNLFYFSFFFVFFFGGIYAESPAEFFADNKNIAGFDNVSSFTYNRLFHVNSETIWEWQCMPVFV